jgi:hypothetical protein
MAILGHHSRLAVPEVTWYYPRFRAFLDTYGDLNQAANFRTLVSEMIFGLKTPFFGLDLNPATIVDELLAKIRAPSFAQAFRAILELYSDSVRKPRWGEKTPHNLYYLPEILDDFPGAKIINLVRDGRDVATEQLRSAFGPRNIYAAALIWRRSREVAETWRQKLPAESWLDVRYEELAAKPEPVLERVCEFLGEKYEPGIPRYHEPLLGWDEEFFAGQRAPRKWKTYFAVKRRYQATDLVL